VQDAANNTESRALQHTDSTVPAQRQAVSRPVPKAQTEDPRAFQISQIQRRFKPEVTERDDVTLFTFGMQPSDPDFPYEIEKLQCILTVPKMYPTSGKPTLQVTNKDIPRGFQINIERGFDLILSSAPESSLLGAMNRLDRQLDGILAGRMADTVKLVPNKGPSPVPAKEVTEQPKPPPQPPVASVSPPITHNLQQKDDAKTRRQAHTRQLEARFGRLQSFSKSADGTSYTMPLDSPKKPTWPISLQALRSFRLGVPELYPLQPASVHLATDSLEARSVEQAFSALPAKLQASTLTQLVNHLVQHLADMASTPAVESQETASLVETPTQAAPGAPADIDIPTNAEVNIDRPHVHIIPRPPEWDQQKAAEHESDDDSDSYESESEDDTNEEGTDDDKPNAEPSTARPAERGVLLSFPHLELYGIELLELVSLGVTIKCERCKDTMDIQRLLSYSGEASSMRNEACKKCANGLAVGFRADLIHMNSVRGGYLDLDGCTVVDMLPR